jgi:hypothetical protein
LNQPRIRFQSIRGAKFLHERRLCADVSRSEIGGAEFVKFGVVDANGVGIDRRSFYMTGHRHDHARINPT